MTDEPRDQLLVSEASRFLIERGLYGVVWLDVDLVVRERSGRLVDFVTIGEPVGRAVLPLFGLDDEMHAVRLGTRRAFELSNIAIIGPDGTGPRLSFLLHWMSDKARFLLIVARTTMQTELEAELENQSRQRALAEARIVEQARELAVANAGLTRANRELSEFAYIISHDLNSPLRALRYQAEDIVRAIESDDDGSIRQIAEGIDRQTRRMSGMLSDLLTYARIGRDGEAIEVVDTGALVQAIVQSLPRPQSFRIEVAGTWPVLETVGPALDLVLRNLIDNAIKHHDRADGTVRIVARPAAPGLHIRVTDDGPGIPAPYHTIVFQPFRKLAEHHPDDDAGAGQGSGIGLSLVRKTVENAGANLRLQSDPPLRRGTVFDLAWPGRNASSP